MRSKVWILLTVITSLMIACASGGDKEKEALLKEAADIHMEALEIEKSFKPIFSGIVQRRNGLSVQGKDLTPEERRFIDMVNGVEKSYEYWEENHMEVPGFEHAHDHDHDHDHDHSHDHGGGMDLLPEDILSIQKEFRDSIKAIKKRAELVAQ